MNVPLLDLQRQYRALQSELDSALLRVASSQSFILGPEVEALERECAAYLNVPHALGVSSGTDALLLALMALEIGPGDEVIVPDYSFFATAGVVSRLGAVPLLADIDPVTFNLRPSEIERLLTPRTRAVIPVHLYGYCAPMKPILELAARHKLYVVEDAAQAFGSRYEDGRRAGTMGHIGCFSFFPTKNLGAFGDGGLTVTRDPVLHEKMKLMRVHGAKPKYYHKVVGGNFRLDAIQAAVLRVKLPHLDAWTEGRRRNARLYNRLFKERGLSGAPGAKEFSLRERVLLPLYPPEPVYEPLHIFNQFVVRVERRDELRDRLARAGIATEIYYPVPFHNQECFSTLRVDPMTFPISTRCAATSLALPIFPELVEEEIQAVVEAMEQGMKGL
jgi:dTDP-4-amino-4,6-dideoxygalactose transaminase